MKPKNVTDHAVLRYMERVCGIPVGEARRWIAQLITEEIASTPLANLRCAKVPIGYNVQAVIIDGACVTIEPAVSTKPSAFLRTVDPKTGDHDEAPDPDPFDLRDPSVVGVRKHRQ